jgi:dephospho-CoA kinase
MRIGLTGGIGSGKSTVAALLVRHGAALVDTDAIARQLAAPGGAAIDAIRASFGEAALDAAGGLNRARMRAQVFAEPGARQRLEAILHPLIGNECESQAAAATGRPLVIDVPLLVEAGHWRRRVDRVWVVDCREATQLERVQARPGWSREAALGVIESQATRAARRAAADAVIYNDGISLTELESQVRVLLDRALHRVEGTTAPGAVEQSGT